jgi:hypothetical protein
MNPIEGAGGTDILNRLLIEAAQAPRRSEEGSLEGESKPKAGMEGALTLSKQYLSASLNDRGFVDIHAGSLARMEAFVEHSLAEPDPGEIAMDPKMAGEIATQAGAELAADADQVLRILARVHPDYVAMLLG